MQIELLKFPYSYMEYEKILQIRELKVLLPEIEVLSDDKHNTIISGERINLDNVKELTFYRAYKIDGISYPTRQGLYEKDDTLRAVKQHTRYSTHGIHEYKGKFNPQIVHAIANIFGVQRGHKVLDPFDGSGTTIAAKFSVSKEVVCRRLLDTKKISQAHYSSLMATIRTAFENEREQMREYRRITGKTIPRNISREAIDQNSSSLCKTFYHGFREGYFDKQDVARYLGVKQNHIDKFMWEVSKW